MHGSWIATVLLFLSRAFVAAQDPVRLIEVFKPDYQYRVSCRVEIEGSLKLPPEKNPSEPPLGKGAVGGPGQTLKIAGKSVIEYHERVLSMGQGRVDKTVRKVHRMDFTRNVGGQDQESKLRADVNLLVIQRLQNLEVPFSPLGPLLWGEIELVRTDVFTPALVGLLPKAPVRKDDDWAADLEAVKELTDLEKINKGGLTCRFEGIDAVNVRLARVSFKGVINGVGEDGPAEHNLEGFFFFDLKSNHISYMSLQGIHRPLNNAGLPQGEIKGTFVLTRDPAESADLNNAALARWNLNPSEQNTQLLFDSTEVRFLYPRHWRVDETNGRQIRLVEKQGSDLLITLDPPAKLPSAGQFQKEVLNGLLQQKAQLVNKVDPHTLQTNPFAVEHFGVAARFGAQAAAFDYYVVRQNAGGATLSARYPPAQAEARRPEAERIARTMVLNVK